MFVQVSRGQVSDPEQVHAALDLWSEQLAATAFCSSVLAGRGQPVTRKRLLFAGSMTLPPVTTSEFVRWRVQARGAGAAGWFRWLSCAASGPGHGLSSGYGFGRGLRFGHWPGSARGSGHGVWLAPPRGVTGPSGGSWA